MTYPVVCCDFCGRDTPNKSRICRVCAGGHQHSKTHAAADMMPWTEYDNEDELGEDAYGPKQAEERASAIWIPEESEWKKV